jgi:hypothetical protein
MSTNNATSARMLMKAAGETAAVTGLTLSTASTLYALKYLTSAGCSLVEYLPFIFNQNATMSFKEHMSNTTAASWYAVFQTIIILICGVVVRKIGTTLTDESTIQGVEKFMYNTQK